jgi:hypothetical protein
MKIVFMNEIKPNLEWCYTLDEFYNRSIEKWKAKFWKLLDEVKARKKEKHLTTF